MWANLFEAEEEDQEAKVKVVVSLTTYDLLQLLKQGEVIATGWHKSQAFDAEFRIVVQGRRTGIGKGNNIIDLRDGGPNLIIKP